MVTKMNKTGVTGSKKVKMNKTTNLQPEQIHQLPAKLNQKQTKNPIS